MFSDKMHFYLNNYENEQTWNENNHHNKETSLHPAKMPFIRVEHIAQEQRVAVNGLRYRAILNEYFLPIVMANNPAGMLVST